MAKIPHMGPSPLASERCAEPTQLFPISVMGKVKRVVEIASLKAICKLPVNQNGPFRLKLVTFLGVATTTSLKELTRARSSPNPTPRVFLKSFSNQA